MANQSMANPIPRLTLKNSPIRCMQCNTVITVRLCLHCYISPFEYGKANSE
jgi:hypothetical protein